MKKRNQVEIWGIITGDIVRSSRLLDEERQGLVKFFHSKKENLIAQSHSGRKIMGPEIFRGDSWQMGMVPAVGVLRVGIEIRLELKAGFKNLDTRIAIGIGMIQNQDSMTISTGYGPAYTLSGKLLDNMGDSRMLLRTEKDPERATSMGRAIDLAVNFLDERCTSMTQSQAQAVLGALLGKNQVGIARDWKPKAIKQQTVFDHLKAANWKLIQESLLFVESLLGDWQHLEGGEGHE